MELAAARLQAAFGPCAHPGAVPVDLLLTGEVVAWLCPDCGQRLPAGWAEVSEEAASLAGSTQFSYDDWKQALTLIGDRPQRDALVEAATKMALNAGRVTVWPVVAALLKVLDAPQAR